MSGVAVEAAKAALLWKERMGDQRYDNRQPFTFSEDADFRVLEPMLEALLKFRYGAGY